MALAGPLKAIRTAKNFLKEFRDYGKGRHKHSKLVSMALHLIPLAEYLEEQRIKPAPEFLLLLGKVRFFSAAHAEDNALMTLAPATAQMLQSGAAALFANASGQAVQLGGVTAGGWLRSVVVKGAVLAISTIPEAAAMEEGKRCAADMREVISILRNGWAPAEAIADVFADLEVARTILEAGTGGAATPVQVNEATTRLGEDRLKAMAAAFKQAGAAEVFAFSQAFVARNAKDNVADAGFESAVQFLQDDRLPQEVPNPNFEDTTSLVNFGFVSSMGIAEHLTESLDGVNEATAMWSELRRDEQASGLEAWAARFCVVSAVVDKGLTTRLHQLFKEEGLLDAMAPSEVGVPPPALSEVLAPLSNTCEKVLEAWQDEGAWASLLETSGAYATSAASKMPSLAKALAAGLAPLQKDAQVRIEIKRLVECLRTLGAVFVPSDSADALEEFRVQDAKGNKAGSFVGCALAVVEAADQVSRACGPDSKFGVKPGSALYIHLSDDDEVGAGGEETATADECIDLAEATALPQRVAVNNVVVGSVRAWLSGALKEVFASLVKALRLDGVVLHGEVAPAEALPAQLGALVDAGHWGPSVATLRRLLEASTDGVSPPTSSLFDLFRNLYRKFLGQEPFPVESVGLVRASSWPVQVPKDEMFRVLGAVVPISEAASILALLHADLQQPARLVDNFELKKSVRVAISELERRLRSGAGVLAKPAAPEGDRVIDWFLPERSLKEWVVRASKLIPLVKVRCIEIAGAELERLSGVVSKTAPRVDHVIDEEKYLKPLAKNNLLLWKGRQGFGESTVQLFRCMSGLAALHGQFGVEEPLADICGDAQELARGVFADAKRIVTVIAYVNCIQGMTGDEQRQAAEVLLAKGETVPAPLVAELRQIVAAGGGRGTKRRAEALDEKTSAT